MNKSKAAETHCFFKMHFQSELHVFYCRERAENEDYLCAILD
jgi:hypothetical protein